MKLLTYQCSRFAWAPHSQTLEGADPAVADEVAECLVAFVHVQAEDTEEDRRKRAFRHALKHLKWLANKRKLRNIVLHSFAHLGGTTADPEFARQLIEDLQTRLTDTGYSVSTTPFGWFCSWELAVYGDSLAKVFKEI